MPGDFDVIARIQELCELRGWSFYRLSKQSGIPYSTLNTMLHSSHTPSIPSLAKICDGFGITLSEFFAEAISKTVSMSKEELELLKRWNKLNPQQRELAMAYICGLGDGSGQF